MLFFMQRLRLLRSMRFYFSALLLKLILSSGAALAQEPALPTSKSGEAAKNSAAPVQPEEESMMLLEKKLRHKKVVITAIRSESNLADAPMQIEVISKEDIRNRGARTVSDVLNNQTGFFIQRSFAGDNIQIQGLDSTYLLILRDGERLNGRINGGQYDLSRLRVENIERIEILRGSSSAVYGADAIAGVINIVTRRPDKPRFEARVQGGNMGQFDTAAALTIPLGEKFGVKAAGGYRTMQPFRYDDTKVETNGRGIVDYSGEGGLEYNFAQNWVAAVQGDYQRRRLWGVDKGTGGGYFDRTNLTETAQGAFRIQTRRNADTVDLGATERDDNKLKKEINQNYSKADFRLNGSYTAFRDQFLYDQQKDIAQDSYEETRENTYVVHAQAAIPVFNAARWTTGAEGFFEDITTPRVVPNFNKRNRISGYTQFETKLLDSLVLAPGMRYDRDSQFGDYVSPRLGIKWGGEDFIIRGSLGMGYRAPSFRELYLYFENPSAGYVVNGNSALKAESSKSANLGVEAFLTKRMSIDSNAYFNELTNLIQTSTAGQNGSLQQYQYKNIASAFTTGVDNRLTYYLNKYWRATLGYSLTYAFDRNSARLLEGRALHRGTVGLLLRYKRLMFRVQLALLDKRPYYNDVTGQPPSTVPIYSSAYATVDANVEIQIKGGLSVFAGGENLNSSADATYLPLPPARIYAGMRYILGE